MSSILGEFAEFWRFLKSIWGVLTGISAFFPFFNLATEAIPYPEPRLKGPSSLLAMMGSAFVCILLFKLRYELLRLDQSSSVRIGRQRWLRIPLAGHRSTALGALALGVFSWLVFGYVGMVYGGRYVPAEQAIFWYASLFASATLGFGTLATSEYMKRKREREGSRAYRTPLNQVATQAVWERIPEHDRPKYSHLLEVVRESLRKEGVLRVLSMVMKTEIGAQYEMEIDENEEVRYFGAPRKRIQRGRN